MKTLTFSKQVPVHKAAIKLEQIHTPVSKRLSVCLIVTQTARVSSTGTLPHVCVDTKLQPLGMDLKGDKCIQVNLRFVCSRLQICTSRWRCCKAKNLIPFLQDKDLPLWR